MHYDGLHILSHNAIFNFVNTNRNYGKTWTFKRRAFRRALKHGKKTIWLRRFKGEVKEAVAKFFTSSDLQKFCGIEWYDPETKNGNCKQVGNTFYIRRHKKWEWFLQVVALSDCGKMRGVDDIAIDTIIFDEYTTTPARYARYRGNEVVDFLDILYSVKREHEVKCIFLGNKESLLNPYLTYFGIPPEADSYQGIKTYRNGSICVEYINNKQNSTVKEYNKKLENALQGTSYGRYIFESETKGKTAVKLKFAPRTAITYTQLKVNGNYIRIAVDNDGKYYVSEKVDLSRAIYCDEHSTKPRHYYLAKSLKKYFIALQNAIIDNRVYYSSAVAYEKIQPFYKWAAF